MNMTFNVLGSLRSVVRCSRYTGLFPFNINEDGSVTLSIPLLIVFILVQSSFSVLSVSFFLYRWMFQLSIVHETLVSLGQFSIQCAQISLIISLIKNRKLLNETFKTLVLMENLDEPISGNGCLWYPTLCGILLVGTPIMEIASEMTHFMDIEFVLIILKWELAYFGIFQFTGLLNICRNCFVALNNRLKNRLRGYSKWEAVEKSEQLMKCCESINTCYGSMLLIILISFFGLIVINLYSAYLKWKYKWVVFICLLSAFVLFSTFHYLVDACSKTADTVNQFNRHIHNSLIQDILLECIDQQWSAGDSCNVSSEKHEVPKPNATFKKIIFQSSLAMEAINRQEMEFTASGYFPINYSLFYSMIETSATYLIICIQSSDYNEVIWEGTVQQSTVNSTDVFASNETDFFEGTIASVDW